MNKRLTLFVSLPLIFASLSLILSMVGLILVVYHESGIHWGNWSGYETYGSQFTSVTGSWIVPHATCKKNETTSSSMWVGLGGDTSVADSNNSLEQEGTDSDCIGGIASYMMWTEVVPQDGYSRESFPVRAGDKVTSLIQFNPSTGVYVFNVWINDVYHLLRQQKGDSLGRQSAEWIVEAPLDVSGGNIFPLANFGSVDFVNCMADGKPIDSWSYILNQLSEGPDSLTTVGSLQNGNFNVSWVQAT